MAGLGATAYAAPSSGPTYGPSGGLPGLNGQPWMHGDGNLGYGPTDQPAQTQQQVSSAANTVDPNSIMAQAQAANTAYMQAFQQNIAQSRTAIQQQFQAALADINANEGRAGQAIAPLSGQINGLYDQAAATMTAQGAASQKQANAYGNLQSFSPAGAGTQPMQDALTSQRTARQADIPLLKLGSQSMFAGQRGAATQANLRAGSDLSQAAAQGNLQQLQGQSQFAQQLGLAQLQHQWTQQDAAAQSQAQLAQQKALWLQQNPAPPGKDSAQYFRWMQTANPQAAAAITNSPAFRYAQQSMTTGLATPTGAQAGVGGMAGSIAATLNPGARRSIGGGAVFDAGTQMKPLTMADITKKYASNPQLVSALKYWYGTTKGGTQ